ncbi:MAG: PP2C family protein-serine/threonine phosphatase [Phycisphaerae bacterium]
MRALIVNPLDQPLPEGTSDLFDGLGWDVVTARDYRDGVDAVRSGSITAVLLPEPANPSEARDRDGAFADLMKLVHAQRIAAVVLADSASPTAAPRMSLVDVVDRHTSIAELRGRFAMIERYHFHFQRMEMELRTMERLGKRLHEHFQEFEQEMQLAGRLQRDFLPRIDGPIHNVHFATIYRPASWVSGDTFDVFRVDERYTGIYVADAVGHGMAASLLTMFIRRAIVPKQVHGDRYTVFSPSETMTALNDALVDQALPNCQFVTVCYCLFDHKNLTLQYARGGHPYPLLITAGGALSELKASGGLLGLARGQEFPTFETQMSAGDKLLLYTDGVELAFQRGNDGPLDTTAYRRVFEETAALPLTQMLREVEAKLDDDVGSLNPEDDITIAGFEVLAA